MIEEAFNGVCPDKEFTYDAKIKYSGRFKGYNANIRLNRFTKELIFNLKRILNKNFNYVLKSDRRLLAYKVNSEFWSK